MKINRIVSNLLNSNMYIIEENYHALVIDACSDFSLFSSNIQYDKILLTHEHYDHISGVQLWKEKTGMPVICSEACAEAICNPVKNMSRYFREFCELQTFIKTEPPKDIVDYACEADETFRDSMSFEWQGHKIELISCPGHSEGSILILIDRKHLFSGDTILEEFPKERRMAGEKQHIRNISKESLISTLKSELIVHPGHFEEFSLYQK